MEIKVKVPATTANLGPGFDCLGIALDLYNEFVVEESKDKKLQIQVIGDGAEFIEKDTKNIVYKSIKKVCDICNKPIPSLSLKIVNKIPVSRGLGSSASARVAGVIIGNILCSNKFSKDELINIATELEGHPDNVVPSMVGGLCVSTKIVKKNNKDFNFEVKYIKLVPPDDLVALVLIPNIKISTDYARKVLPKMIDYTFAVRNVNNVAMLLSSIFAKKYSLLKFSMEDFLHQPFREKIMPWMNDVFKICLENKALGVALSGSGSSVLAVYEKKVLTKKIAQQIKNLVSKKVVVEYKILNFVSCGAKVVVK
jgi:homoserine kinase